jgi:hypothetical protein
MEKVVLRPMAVVVLEAVDLRGFRSFCPRRLK